MCSFNRMPGTALASSVASIALRISSGSSRRSSTLSSMRSKAHMKTVSSYRRYRPWTILRRNEIGAEFHQSLHVLRENGEMADASHGAPPILKRSCRTQPTADLVALGASALAKVHARGGLCRRGG